MDDPTDYYCVLRNDEEQYSIWPKSRSVPAGWEPVGHPASKAECLQRIEELWTDMRPASLRRELGLN